jgi:hypothetical protein
MTNEQNNADNTGDWSSDKLGDEASLKDKDEIQREIRRGGENEGDADERDAAGSASSDDTPQGREEAKNDKKGVANVNG